MAEFQSGENETLNGNLKLHTTTQKWRRQSDVIGMHGILGCWEVVCIDDTRDSYVYGNIPSESARARPGSAKDRMQSNCCAITVIIPPPRVS